MTNPVISRQMPDVKHDILRDIEDRVLWPSSAIVHHANRVCPNTSGLKVSGHQASCASMVSIMTTLWFKHLRPEDRVSVKPHASPVTRFGQSGSIEDVYRYHGLDSDSIVRASLDLTE